MQSRPLTVLITNMIMDWPSGTVVYTRDLALELKRRGHVPIVYTWFPGKASRDLGAAGIEVVTSLWKVRTRPDVIHGHHRPLVSGALLRFPGVPVIAFCHNPIDPWDAPAPDPAILRYCGVSERTAAQLIKIGAPPAATIIRPNFVDLDVFKARDPLPESPKRAMVFSNYANGDNFLPAIQQAMGTLGIPLDVVGHSAGRTSEVPHDLLPGYDLVFAVGKSALEAMAVGAAVVLCDRPGLGPMVTASDLERLRPLNFGMMALTEPVTPAKVLEQARRYDAAEATRVRDIVRSSCGLQEAVRDLLDLYHQVIDEAHATAACGSTHESRRARLRRSAAGLRYRVGKAPAVYFYRVFGLGPRRVPAPFRPMYRLLRQAFRRTVGVV